MSDGTYAYMVDVSEFPVREMVFDVSGYDPNDQAYYQGLADCMNHWGMDHQGLVTMETCDQLSIEVSRFCRGVGNVQDITDAIANVLLMLDQVSMALDIDMVSIMDAKSAAYNDMYSVLLEEKQQESSDIDARIEELEKCEMTPDVLVELARLKAIKFNR